MRRTALAAGVAALALALPAVASADATFNVGSQANIWGAGHSTVNGRGDGSLPVEVVLPGGTHRILTFPSVTGAVSCNGSSPNVGPDGGAGCGSDSTDVSGVDGIAGISSVHAMYLTGVFLDSTEPSGAPGAGLSFPDDASEDFADLSPGLNQPFFIGDGQNSSGTQVFHVPDGATRLYLGLADACANGAFHGPPNCYADNTGSFSATVHAAWQLDSRTARSASSADTNGLDTIDGDPYLVTVTGTYSAFVPSLMAGSQRGWVICGSPVAAMTPSPGAPTSLTGQDAEFLFARPQINRCDPNFKLPHKYAKGTPVLVIDNGTGFKHYTPLSKGYSSSHSYTYEVPGTGGPINLRLLDKQTDDNFGVLTVEIVDEVS